ncbi:MAG: ANTAR domain-containing protein [Lachnospiraceae bacterium]|jgi:response regulator NasT|nr:ANTAR domain-containing protein [Lachnospiraceae bacterium]
MEAGVIVAFPRIDDAKNVKNILVRNGIKVAAVVSSGFSALSVADSLGSGVIISAYRLPDMPYFEIRECMPEGFEMLLVASKDRLNECQESDIVKLTMPFVISDLVDTVGMMTASIVRKKKNAGKIPRKRTEEEKHILDLAKGILMDRNGFTEEEAHKYIQKCSMDSGTNIVESARMVFSMYGVSFES